MSAANPNTNRIWPNWWRFGGVDGIIWAVLFVVGIIIIQGEPPSRDDSIDSIRQYFVDDGDMYLVGDYLTGIGFVIFFLPYLIALRWYLGVAEGSPPIWSWMTFTGGLVAVILGGIASVFWGAMALGLRDNPDLDDATIRLLMDIDAFAFNGISLGLALFVGSAGFIVLRTGIFWRWLGAAGLLAALLLLIGAAWPIDGDDEGALAAVGIPGLILTLLFVIVTSVAMIMRKEPPDISGAA
jgi:hypothetical protein